FSTAFVVSLPQRCSAVLASITPGYLAGCVTGCVATAEGALEARRRRTAARGELSRGGEAPEQVRVDRIAALRHSPDQVAELDRGRPGGIAARLDVELGRGDDHLPADVRQLSGVLLGDQAVGDRRRAREPDRAGGPLESAQVAAVGDEAGVGSEIVLLRPATGGPEHERGGEQGEDELLEHPSILRPPRPIP